MYRWENRFKECQNLDAQKAFQLHNYSLTDKYDRGESIGRRVGHPLNIEVMGFWKKTQWETLI